MGNFLDTFWREKVYTLGTFIGKVYTFGGKVLCFRYLIRKALRSYFSLKKTIDIDSLSVKAVLKLFDSLILPVLTYGIQAWYHNTKIASVLGGQSAWSIKSISRDPLEKIHMQIIKWTLGIHKKASNIGSYGDTGRLP